MRLKSNNRSNLLLLLKNRKYTEGNLVKLIRTILVSLLFPFLMNSELFEYLPMSSLLAFLRLRELS